MQTIITDQFAPIHALCQKHGVKVLYVFGSATRDDFNPDRSDLDFLVEFFATGPIQHATQFFALETDLQQLFTNRVDLGEVDGVRNERMQRIIEKSRISIYAAA